MFGISPATLNFFGCPETSAAGAAFHNETRMEMIETPYDPRADEAWDFTGRCGQSHMMINQR